MSCTLLAGALLSLDGFMYARTASDVTLIILIFVAVVNTLAALMLGRPSIKNVNSSNLVRDPVPLVES